MGNLEVWLAALVAGLPVAMLCIAAEFGLLVGAFFAQ